MVTLDVDTLVPGDHTGDTETKGGFATMTDSPADAPAFWLDRVLSINAGTLPFVGELLLLCVAIVALGWGWWQWRSMSARPGMATRVQMRRSLSARAARRGLPQTRAALARLPLRQRLILLPAEYGIRQGRAVGTGTAVVTSPEEQELVIGPPRSGKTADVGNDVLDAPGAVVVTTTKTDLYELTAPVRAGKAPVWLLNPERLGGPGRFPSTLRWSPVLGCEDPRVARDRAGYLVAGAPVGSNAGVRDGNFWESTAATVLRAYLHAAALSGRGMVDVVAWTANRTDPTPYTILSGDPRAAGGWADALAAMSGGAEATARSIWTTLGQVLEFMQDPAIAEVTLADPADQFDVADFLARRGTLYLLGSDRPHGSLGPLFTAFAGYLFEQARDLASQRPGGRLDPWLTMALDEAPQICPVPLDRWLPDAGGRGIRCVVVAQSRSQLYHRWGTHGGDTIWQMCTVKTVLRGLSVVADLEDISRLCGEVDDEVTSTSRDRRHRNTSRHTSPQRRRVLPPEEVRMLPEGQQLLLHTGTRPLLVTRQPVWERRVVKHARRRATPSAVPTGSTPTERGRP